jgi:hypothetical protein
VLTKFSTDASKDNSENAELPGSGGPTAAQVGAMVPIAFWISYKLQRFGITVSLVDPPSADKVTL